MNTWNKIFYFQLFNFTFSACKSPCATCQLAVDKCDTCIEGYVAFLGTCERKCEHIMNSVINLTTNLYKKFKFIIQT